jgi:membrane-associated protease RseP (regulator of RpoE activity)
MKALLLVAATAVMSVAATLDAQGVKGQPDSTCTKYSDGRVECRVFRRRLAEDSAFGNRIFLRMDSAMAKRAALGLELRATGTRRDTLGVFIEAVTPKGPAESAGIIEGDRIAAINGVDLRTPVADIDDSYSNALASHRLTREVQKLAPGSRVTLRVYSGGRFRDVQVVAGKASDLMRFGNHFRIGFPGGDGMMEFEGPGGMRIPDPQMQIFRDRLGGPERRPVTVRPRRPIIRSGLSPQTQLAMQRLL